MLWLDVYERRARLAPGLLALLPIAVVITALGLRDAPVVAVAVSLLSVISGPLLIASVVRQKGQAAQEQLWERWGGPPTTRFLRTRDTAANAVQRDSWREAVEAATKVSLLSAQAEKANPAEADDTIAVAVAKLRTLTGSDTFTMIKAENRNYGFERNLYGIRDAARIIAVIAVVAIAGVIAWRVIDGLHPSVPVSYVLGLAVNLLILIGWFVFPSAERTRVTAEQYAHQLLQSAVTLSEGASA